MTRPTLDLDSDHCLIVAELSANHGGSLQKAMDTIGAAAEAGADAIKLQTYTADTMTIDSAREEFLISGGPWDGYRLYELYQEAFTPWEWHEDLIGEGARLGLPVFSTPFDHTAVDFLEGLGVGLHKIASFENVDLELIERVAETRKPVVMSTGMASLADLDRAVGTLRRVWGAADPGLVLLRCVSSYPAPPEAINLRSIPHLAEAFGVKTGLSDHTLGAHVAIASVALGARMIEKHFILQRSDGGPDSHFSIEPAEFREMVRSIRDVEAALGTPTYGDVDAEGGSLRFRRSIFVVKDVAEGEPFTRENVRVIRPGHGLPPRELPHVLGRRAAANFERGTPLTMDMLA